MEIMLELGSSALFIYEKCSRGTATSFIFLLLAIQTIPFLRQIFLFNTGNMKPLFLAIWALASYHFSVWGSAAITINRLFAIILKVPYFYRINPNNPSLYLIWAIIKCFVFLSPEHLFLLLSFILHFLSQFCIQLLLILID
jgi:hypothetical protein